jgi:hypothetical protein
MTAATDPRYGSDDYKLETAALGPVHRLHYGHYYAVVRNGVPMIERANTKGAVLHVEETT